MPFGWADIEDGVEPGRLDDPEDLQMGRSDALGACRAICPVREFGTKQPDEVGKQLADRQALGRNDKCAFHSGAGAEAVTAAGQSEDESAGERRSWRPSS